METYYFSIKNMRCVSCASIIENSLSKNDKIARVISNFATHSVQVSTDLDPIEIIKILNDIGYSAELEKKQGLAKQEIFQKEYYQLIIKAAVAGIFGVTLMSLEFFGILPMEIINNKATINVSAIQTHTYAIHSFSAVWIYIGIWTFLVMLYSGWHFYRSAAKLAAHLLHSNMDTLIAISTICAWIYSMLVVILPDLFIAEAQKFYFESALMIIAFVNIGQAIEMRSRGEMAESVDRLMSLQPKIARVIRDGKEQDILINDIILGDVIRVRPGEKIPIDGEISDGNPTIDESMITGESMPVTKNNGDTVIGGTLNGIRPFLYKVTKVGEETVISKIIELVKNSQNAKVPIGRIVDKVSSYFVPTVITIAFFTALFWCLFGPDPKISYALPTAISVLLISCPCSLGIAVPIAIVIGIGRATQSGIIIRNGSALQLISKITTMVFDKTGTLTVGHPLITGVYPIKKNMNSDAIIKLAASVEINSEHLIGTAIVRYAKEHGIQLLSCYDFEEVSGKGVKAKYEDSEIFVGNDTWMLDNNIKIDIFSNQLNTIREIGETPVFIAKNNELVGVVGINDMIKPEAKKVVDKLKQYGIKVVMLTGDSYTAARHIADEIKIDNIFANVLPQDKHNIIKNLQEKGEIVGMVGDGINDAPALAKADVGFAIGSGTDVSIESADVVLIRNSLETILYSYVISYQAMNNIKENIFWAFLYNIISIPVATGIFYPFVKMLLHPMFASMAMVLSSLTVIGNTVRLKYMNIDEIISDKM